MCRTIPAVDKPSDLRVLSIKACHESLRRGLMFRRNNSLEQGHERDLIVLRVVLKQFFVLSFRWSPTVGTSTSASGVGVIFRATESSVASSSGSVSGALFNCAAGGLSI
jgi:hypothetical protein